jgi:alpha-glucosidase
MRGNEPTDQKYSRREFLAVTAAAPILLSVAVNASPPGKDGISVASPNGQVRFFVDSASPRLAFRISFKNKPVIESSQIGIVIDGADLGNGVDIKRTDSYRGMEKYAWRGVHSEAVNNFRGTRIQTMHSASKTDFTVDVRVFDDGVALRYIVPGNGKARILDETTTFTLPAGTTSWFHDFYGHYEGTHQRKEIADTKDGEWAAPPITFKLPKGNGYAAITEAALMNYAGMGLRADGNRSFKAVLGHALPVSHPYELRYPKSEIERLSKPAAIEGTITTPWRVIMIGTDLDALVNSDIIHNVSLPPDKTLFPEGFSTDWIRPGRAVWRYLDGGENTLESMKEFSRLAGRLGFEHNIVEGFWRRWTEDQMRELVDYSKQFGVGIWFWAHSKDLHTPESRQRLFEQLNRVGVVGSKIDFFDHEAKEVIDLYQALLRDAAEHKIMLEFHGSNKPSGESRTWPNELTRESVRGMEYRSMTERAMHNTTLPFTRFLAGHADYTPVHFGERRRETSWTHQIATAAVFTSPLMIYGAHPKNLLENPAVEMIKSIPSTWDETRVLPVSEIGEVAAFARRKGDTWFLAILNGPDAKTLKIPLAFLNGRKYDAMIVRDKFDNAAALNIENSNATNRDTLNIQMRPAGGFMGRFVMAANLAKETRSE